MSSFSQLFITKFPNLERMRTLCALRINYEDTQMRFHVASKVWSIRSLLLKDFRYIPRYIVLRFTLSSLLGAAYSPTTARDVTTIEAGVPISRTVSRHQGRLLTRDFISPRWLTPSWPLLAASPLPSTFEVVRETDRVGRRRRRILRLA